ncbi:MAG: hypothetical protein LR015_07035 [Verrucomicrobia bacterium]|nr:hypothetical protein [Verrucomicrobiota bacterium]
MSDLIRSIAAGKAMTREQAAEAAQQLADEQVPAAAKRDFFMRVAPQRGNG